MRPRRLNAIEQMHAATTRLLEGTREIAPWQWDESYWAALVIVTAPHEAEVLDLVNEALPHTWDPLAIKSAPEQVRRAAGVWGGLMTGQRFFVLDAGADPMMYAAWWPWGGRHKFSLRVSCSARAEAVVKADPQARLRGWFGL
jgi:hypothetical protein